MTTTNKADLIEMVAEQAGLTKASAEKALTAVLSGITDSLTNGKSVVLVNFGTFTVKERAAREGRNPQTGEKMKIKAQKVVSFKAGKSLKDEVRDSK